MSSKVDASAMATPKRPKPLSAFQKLSPQVFLYDPPASNLASSTASRVNDTSPTTIIFCAWMNASLKHIDYYTSTYMHLYPQARIIVVTISTNQFMFQTESKRRSDMQIALSAIQPPPDSPSSRLFIHGISNGGAKRVYNFVGAYLDLTRNILPVTAQVLDCSIGVPSFGRDLHALTFPARNLNWFMWTPIYLSTLVIVSVVYVSVHWMPKWFWGELVWTPTIKMNDPKFLDGKCVKGYIYSKEDIAIYWRDVERHADVAEGNGYSVHRKLVEGAGHAVLFKGKGGEKDYWDWVQGIWEKGLQVKR